MHRNIIAIALLGALLGVAGCGNDHFSLDLGDVSIGQQLVDLKNARDEGALSASEYRAAKARLLALLDAADRAREDGDKDKDSDASISIGIEEDGDSHRRRDRDDDESDWLF